MILYKPLPTEVTIKKSSIHGLGLFATKDIPKNHRLGTMHIEHFDELVRTPLGGFINHSDEPNCKKVKNIIKKEDLLGKWSSIQYELVTTKKITQGDEITLRYSLYKIQAGTFCIQATLFLSAFNSGSLTICFLFS